MRTENDSLGTRELPEGVLYGIHALRAMENFNNSSAFNLEWYKAIGTVKQACFQTVTAFIEAALKKYPGRSLPVGCDEPAKFTLLEQTAEEIGRGMYFDQFIVPAIQGGAGTAINMNINEILCNASLVKQGSEPGRYDLLDPFLHANIFQSTNDVVPSALKLALMRQFNLLEQQINALRNKMEQMEGQHRNNLRLSYTQMQRAVPSSFGMLFSTWSDALSRDWWRVSKCFERIKVINLGGGATGTALGIPRYFVMEVTNRLRQISGLPVTRSENHSDTTQNLDSLVEVHAILKAHAVNLEKIAADLRLLASDISGNPQMILPGKQTGSSIMPGKINPVISEFAISAAHKVYSNDMLVSNLCGQGTLDLNAYLPTIGHAMLESIHLLIKVNESMLHHLLNGLEVQQQTAKELVLKSPTLTTALLPAIGYQKATQMAHLMQSENLDIFQANQKLRLLDDDLLLQLLQPERLLQLGYSLGDLPD